MKVRCRFADICNTADDCEHSVPHPYNGTVEKDCDGGCGVEKDEVDRLPPDQLLRWKVEGKLDTDEDGWLYYTEGTCQEIK